ncbi:MAG: hypothetical protein FWF81_01495 [Defluviitaleaceae bacterium]|nr:hypothetical protein [Defluviitaleaceae bacterium]
MSLISVPKQLHPITNTFVVRRGLDPGAPAILECYNMPPPMRPLNTSHFAFSGNYGVVSETFTFACNNITDSHCRWVGQLSHEYGGNWRIEYDLLVFGAMPQNIWQDPNDPWYNPHFTDRQIVRIDRFTGGNNEKRTISYHSPSRGSAEFSDRHNWTRNDAGTAEAGLTGWAWPQVGAGGKDVVFWLFDYTFDSPAVAGSISLTPRGGPWIPWEDRLTSGNFQTFYKTARQTRIWRRTGKLVMRCFSRGNRVSD